MHECMYVCINECMYVCMYINSLYIRLDRYRLIADTLTVLGSSVALPCLSGWSDSGSYTSRLSGKT